MTQEQKAKAYEEALERAKSEYQTHKSFNGFREMLAHIFPELKESEDERIRKEIMDFIDTKTIDSDERRNRWFSYLEKNKPISFTSLENTKVKMSLMQYISELNQDVVHLHPGIETCNEWIAWLEKQDKQPSAIRWYDVSLIPQEMEELLVEWDSEDATWYEIAFYHADTKTFWDGTRQVENVTRWCYIIDLLEKQGDANKEYWRGYREGKQEILNKYAELEKQSEKNTKQVSIWKHWKDGIAGNGDSEPIYLIKNGYTYSLSPFLSYECDYIELSELDKLMIEKQGEKKPAWSEDDEKRLQSCINILKAKSLMGKVDTANTMWLKSLKQRIGG